MLRKPTTWTIQEHRDEARAVVAYQARGVYPAQPAALPLIPAAIGPALGRWHYLAEHGEDEARRLAEADGEASGLPRAEE